MVAHHHQWKLCHNYGCVDQHKYFFTQHVIKLWNNLKITLDDWGSVAKFRSLIKKLTYLFLCSIDQYVQVIPWLVCCFNYLFLLFYILRRLLVL